VRKCKTKTHECKVSNAAAGSVIGDYPANVHSCNLWAKALLLTPVGPYGDGPLGAALAAPFFFAVLPHSRAISAILEANALDQIHQKETCIVAHDLLIELFPIETQHLPQLGVYRPLFADSQKALQAGEALAHHFSRTFSGQWLWDAPSIVTDSPVSPMQMQISVDLLRHQFPDLYGALQSVDEDPHRQPTSQDRAAFVEQTLLRDLEGEIRAALNQMGVRIPKGYIMREHRIATWLVDNHPALSISVQSHLVYERNLQQYMAHTAADAALGLRVMQRTALSRMADVVAVTGRLSTHRERLIAHSEAEALRRYLRDAPDDDYVLRLSTGAYEYDYPASLLRVVVRRDAEADWRRFEINRRQALKALHPTPELRAKLVRVVSDILKEKGIIGNAFNSRTHKQLFASMEFMPNLVYANKRVRPYAPQTMAGDFMQSGLFARHPRFEEAPIKLALINTLDSIATDFVEALRRQLERDFGFEIDLLRERNVRVVSEKNIASAVRVVEKERPHLVLAFFPDAPGRGDRDADYLKSLTLGKGIASHALYESTINNPNAMGLVMMSLLAKTGNIPFALAEPLEYSNWVVGLDLVRVPMTRADRVVAMARIYRRDGVFLRYIMETIELEAGEPMPFVVLQTLFPEVIFKGQQIILHHQGALPTNFLELLARWADVLEAQFFPVEILPGDVPRLYALDGGIAQPAWGSTCRLNHREAIVVSTIPRKNQIPRPLHLRVPDASLPIEQAVYSVLAWTLLHYDRLDDTKLPVTIQHAADLAGWMARGMIPEQTAGAVPFWL